MDHFITIFSLVWDFQEFFFDTKKTTGVNSSDSWFGGSEHSDGTIRSQITFKPQIRFEHPWRWKCDFKSTCQILFFLDWNILTYTFTINFVIHVNKCSLHGALWACLADRMFVWHPMATEAEAPRREFPGISTCRYVVLNAKAVVYLSERDVSYSSFFIVSGTDHSGTWIHPNIVVLIFISNSEQ